MKIHKLTLAALLVAIGTLSAHFIYIPVDFIQNAVIFYHEPHASSTCEMVTELLQYMNGKPLVTPLCANALLAGIILDTKDFVLRTGVRTFEAAAYLRSRGADTVVVKRFFNSSMENKKLRGQIVLNAQSYRRCAVSVADVQTKEIGRAHV